MSVPSPILTICVLEKDFFEVTTKIDEQSLLKYRVYFQSVQSQNSFIYILAKQIKQVY